MRDRTSYRGYRRKAARVQAALEERKFHVVWNEKMYAKRGTLTRYNPASLKRTGKLYSYAGKR